MNPKEFVEFDLEKRFGYNRKQMKSEVFSIARVFSPQAESLYKIQDFLRETGDESRIGKLLNSGCIQCKRTAIYCGTYKKSIENGEEWSYWHLCLNCLEVQLNEKEFLVVHNYPLVAYECPFCEKFQIKPLKKKIMGLSSEEITRFLFKKG